MLTDGIASAFRAGCQQVSDMQGVDPVVSGTVSDRTVSGSLFRAPTKSLEANPGLAQKVFGPLGIVFVAESADEFRGIAMRLEGQLTVTLHMDQGENALANTLLPVLERKAGRVLFNGFPTGVEVAESMVHGGPHPASTNFGATSVGTMAIRRFLRPVCYQNSPDGVVLPG